jgi:PAS domain S-box-containing protein
MKPYAVASVAVAAAVLLRMLLDPWLGNAEPLTTVFGAVTVAIWLGGYRPAIFAALLGYLACDWLFLPPRGSFTLELPAERVGLAGYVMTCAIVIGFGEAVRAGRRSADRANAKSQHEALERRRAEDELRRGEADLRKSEERFRLFMDNSPVAAFVKDEAGRYLYVNHAIAQRLNRTPGEIIGKTDLELRDPAEAARLRANDRSVLDSGKPAEFEEALDVQEGTRHYLTFKFPLEGSGDSRLIGGVAHDITERKLAGQRTAADLSAMVRLGEIGRLCAGTDAELAPCLAEILAAAISFTGADKGALQLYDPLRRTFSLATSRGLDEPSVRFFATVAEGSAASSSVAMSTGQRVIFEDVAQSEALIGPASLGVLREAGVRALQTTPLLSGAGNLLGMITTHFARPHRPDERELQLIDLLALQAADFIERKRAEAELLRLNAELQEASRRKDEFLATLAHELRNPLAPIRYAVEMLKIPHLSAAERQSSREVIERQAVQMTQLLKDLLDVSRIGRNQVQLRKARVRLSTVIEDAVEATRPLFEGARHKLTITRPNAPVYLDADAVRLTQVLSNLLNNAAAYTDPGGQVTVRIEPGEGFVVLRVADNGRGISSEALPRLFDAFSQRDAVPGRIDGGLGIGLFLARRLVELHAGSIEARSDGPGRGSTFEVRLPTAVEQHPQQEPSSGSAGAPGGVPRRRVLIVDDMKDGALSLAALLRLDGHEVEVAYDGEEGIAAAERFRPDVILLDIGLPKLSGYEVCRHIRQQPWGSGIFLIALTGWGQEHDRQRTGEAGFHHHIVKPADPAKLARMLDSLR